MTGKKAARRERAPISLRDAIVAVAELRAFDAPETAQVFELLGWAARTAPGGPAGQLGTDKKPDRTLPQDSDERPPTQRPPDPPQKLEPDAAQRPSTLSTLPRQPSPRPAWLPDAAIQPLQAARLATGTGQAPPLFPPLTARGIFSAVLATWVEEGALDAVRVAAAVAELRPLKALPRTLLRTLRRGVRLVLDTGPAMEPFEPDLDSLETSLSTLLSTGQIERQYFSRCPGRGVRQARHGSRRRWTAPPSGMPVLVVSDFGISGSAFDEQRATTEEWLRFARDVQAQGHRLIGLTPFDRTRWPAELVGSVDFVHWCEGATASGIDRQVRLGQRLGQGLAQRGAP